jgi:hypothetical protein
MMFDVKLLYDYRGLMEFLVQRLTDVATFTREDDDLLSALLAERDVAESGRITVNYGLPARMLPLCAPKLRAVSAHTIHCASEPVYSYNVEHNTYAFATYLSHANTRQPAQQQHNAFV